MRAPLRLLVVIAGTSSLLAAVPTAAPAQSIGDVLGTTIINNTLTQIGVGQIGLPQTPYPDPTTDDGTTTTQPQTTTEQQSTLPNPAHALGYYCRGASKKHVHGQKGTPFSQCVTAMAKLQKGTASSAAAACRSLSHKHVKGMKRTPYAACVAGGKKLLAERPS